ncbi:hypothetical protein DFP86_102391 [Paludibacterium purpuratum]|uniref:Uncharacterized protein n=1 Tax=Paludibacterium purpuratum TaxID=1144873 RepID=A0A4R7BBD7_9NEIS|nr:hypothetical protein DFP86_102391 [Paludibacterium purpuratum]
MYWVDAPGRQSQEQDYSLNPIRINTRFCYITRWIPPSAPAIGAIHLRCEPLSEANFRA